MKSMLVRFFFFFKIINYVKLYTPLDVSTLNPDIHLKYSF
jgi:hypothetical protein